MPLPKHVEDQLFRINKIMLSSGMKRLSGGELRKYAKILMTGGSEGDEFEGGNPNGPVEFSQPLEDYNRSMGDSGGQFSNPMFMGHSPLGLSSGPEIQDPTDPEGRATLYPKIPLHMLDKIRSTQT